MHKLQKFTILSTLALGIAISWGARSLADAVIPSNNTDATSNIAAGELPYGDLISDLDDSGLTSSSDMQDQFSQVAGDSEPLDWQHLDLKKEFGDSTYALTQIVTRVTDTTDNFDSLFTHTLPVQTQPETMATEYSRRINGAEESTVGTSLVVPRMLSAAGFLNAPARVPDATVVYNYHLKPHPLIPTFDLRAPEGTYELTAASPTSFDPIGAISAHGLQYTWTNGNVGYDVNIVPREVDNDTLTFEIDSHQVGTNVTTSTVLVYEQM